MKTATPPLTKDDLKVGGLYRAKRPTKNFFGDLNDRVILWMCGDFVQYDSISVQNGRKYPKVTVDAFLKWTGSVVHQEPLSPI